MIRKILFPISALFIIFGMSLAQGVEYKELKKKLKSGDSAVCIDAIQAIGKLNDSQAVELLAIALEDRNWEVRQSAVIALGKIKEKPAIELLFDALNDVSLNVVAEAVRTIAKIEDPYAMD